MAVVRFNPGNELFGLQREVNRLLTDFFPVAKKAEEFASAVWRPMVDVHEDENNYYVDAELPGLRKEDVKMNYKDGVLTISGERRFEHEQKADEGDTENATAKKGINVHRMERMYGKFHRQFNFTSHVDAERITAKFEDGVLKVVVPKAEVVKPREIEIM